jgi:hypothetical protein
MIGIFRLSLDEVCHYGTGAFVSVSKVEKSLLAFWLSPFLVSEEKGVCLLLFFIIIFIFCDSHFDGWHVFLLPRFHMCNRTWRFLPFSKVKKSPTAFWLDRFCSTHDLPIYDWQYLTHFTVILPLIWIGILWSIHFCFLIKHTCMSSSMVKEAYCILIKSYFFPTWTFMIGTFFLSLMKGF